MPETNVIINLDIDPRLEEHFNANVADSEKTSEKLLASEVVILADNISELEPETAKTLRELSAKLGKSPISEIKEQLAEIFKKLEAKHPDLKDELKDLADVVKFAKSTIAKRLSLLSSKIETKLIVREKVKSALDAVQSATFRFKRAKELAEKQDEEREEWESTPEENLAEANDLLLDALEILKSLKRHPTYASLAQKAEADIEAGNYQKAIIKLRASVRSFEAKLSTKELSRTFRRDVFVQNKAKARAEGSTELEITNDGRLSFTDGVNTSFVIDINNNHKLDEGDLFVNGGFIEQLFKTTWSFMGKSTEKIVGMYAKPGSYKSFTSEWNNEYRLAESLYVSDAHTFWYDKLAKELVNKDGHLSKKRFKELQWRTEANIFIHKDEEKDDEGGMHWTSGSTHTVVIDTNHNKEPDAEDLAISFSTDELGDVMVSAAKPNLEEFEAYAID